jgi:HAMP domain-containing protein
MGLRAKFNIVLLFAFLVGLAVAGPLSYYLVRDDARNDVLQEAAVMIGQANSITAYTDREIAPLLVDQMKLRFLPQIIPFWAVQSNFHSLQEMFPDYSMRQPATNPTNPADRPTDWQADIIEVFRRDPTRTEFVTTRDTATGPILSMSHPIRITDKGCLACHSTPAAAPPTMIDLYGPNNGFGWKMGDVVGAQIVSVPMAVPLERAWHTFEYVMIGLVAVFALIAILLNILLELVIIRPVRRIAAMAGELSLGNMDVPEFEMRGRDEIKFLGDSFNRMRRSLANALKMLEE